VPDQQHGYAAMGACMSAGGDAPLPLVSWSSRGALQALASVQCTEMYAEVRSQVNINGERASSSGDTAAFSGALASTRTTANCMLAFDMPGSE